MLIGKNQSRDTLEYYQEGIDPDIKEAADLLYEVINHSYMCSGNCLEIDINGHREALSNLFYSCKKRIEQIEKGGHKAAFLSMSVLEDTFKKCLPLLLVPVQEVADGDVSQITAVQRLRKLFAENPYSAMWSEKAEQYRKIIESLGFTVNVSDYQDLTAIAEPLLDALTIYQGSDGYLVPKIERVRTGELSQKRPDVMTDVCIYHSEKEFVDAVMSCGKESVIAFGGIAPLNYMINDDIQEKVRGFNERKSNVMRNDSITSEEYDMSVCDYKRYIALGVKSKDTMWIMCMPYRKDYYSSLDNPNSMFYYGKRAGYAPYQVFFKEPPAAEKDTAFLSVPRKGYRLAEIMDEMQKIWLPVFLEETVEKFFVSQPDAQDVYLPEEISANCGSYEVVPLWNTLPAEVKIVFDIPAPETVFAEDNMALTMIEHYNITREDIKEYPVLPKEMDTEEKLRDKFLSYVKMAYEAEIIKHAQKSLEEKDKLRASITDSVFSDSAAIVGRAIKGDLDAFSETLIDGTIIEEKDWAGRIDKTVYHPSLYDYRKRSESSYNLQLSFPYIIWNGQETQKPGVILKIRPKTSYDYAALFGCSKEELPELLRYYDELKHYVRMPDFMNINICMTKRTYKKDFERRTTSK